MATAFSIRRSSLLEATITAYPSGIYTDGFGFGGFGFGGFGEVGGDIYLDLRAALERDLVLRRRTVRLGRQSRGGGGDVGHDPRAAAAAGMFGDNLRLHYTYDPR